MRQKNRRGMILVLVIMLMPIIGILASITISSLVHEKQVLELENRAGVTFYMAELGLNTGLYSFANSNYANPTHDKTPETTSLSVTRDPNAAGNPVGSALTLPAALVAEVPFARVSGGQFDGWYEYKWEPGDSGTPINSQNFPESIRFRVSLVHDPVAAIGSQHPKTWEVVSVATVGLATKTHRLTGTVEGIFDHALFDNGSSNEFFRRFAQSIEGKVHANGDIFMTPSATLTFVSDSVTAGGKFYRGMDAMGNTMSLPSNRIQATRGDASGSLVNLTLGSDDNNWTHPVVGVLNTFDGVIRDEQTGSTRRTPPPVQSFEPNGFYADTASDGGLRIRDDGGGVVTVVHQGTEYSIDSLPAQLSDKIRRTTFYNHAEMRNVTVVELNFNQNSDNSEPLGLAATDYDNGLIYSDLPLALVNAQELPRTQGTSIVSQSTVYTFGDVNKEYARNAETGQSFTSSTQFSSYRAAGKPMTKTSMAIMTKDRIWNLSKNYTPPSTGLRSGSSSQNNPQWNSAQPNSVEVSANSDQEPQEYPGDNAWVNRDNQHAGNSSRPVIELNAALLDGAPLYSEPWSRNSDGSIRWGPYGSESGAPSGAVTPRGHQHQTAYDTFLEDLGSNVVVKKRGSIVHLQNGTMAPLSGSAPYNNVAPNQVAWYRDSFYTPPTRDYGYDPNLKTSPPPFSPQIGAIQTWSPR